MPGSSAFSTIRIPPALRGRRSATPSKHHGQRVYRVLSCASRDHAMIMGYPPYGLQRYKYILSEEFIIRVDLLGVCWYDPLLCPRSVVHLVCLISDVTVDGMLNVGRGPETDTEADLNLKQLAGVSTGSVDVDASWEIGSSIVSHSLSLKHCWRTIGNTEMSRRFRFASKYGLTSGS